MVKSNNADAFKMHHSMMHLSGIWPEANPGLLYKTKTIISWVTGVALSVTMTMEVINDIADFAKLSEILYIMTTMTVYLIKLAGFSYRRKTFQNMLELLKDPIFLSYPDELDYSMARTVKISTLLANAYRYLILCYLILAGAYPILDHKPLPYPFSWDLGRYWLTMYVFQLVAMGSSAWNNSSLDTLTTSLMGIGAAQLTILKEKIICLGDHSKTCYKDDKELIAKLRQCTMHHSAIIKFIEMVEDVFTVGLLAQFAGSITIICNTLFHCVLISATSSQFFMLANYFIVMMTQLSIYCLYGNEIILKSISIGDACYTFNWYNHGAEVGKYIFLIMERSKRPLSISALKFSKLSLASLSSILQWSYSYLALLLKLYRQKLAENEISN